MQLRTILLSSGILLISLSCSKQEYLAAYTGDIGAISETHIVINVAVSGPVEQKGVVIEYTDKSTLETHSAIRYAYFETNHFNFEITGLQAGMLYDFRAFATGEGNVTYGDTISVYTFPIGCNGPGSLSVDLGGACWSRENNQRLFFLTGEPIDINLLDGIFLTCINGYPFDRPVFYSHEAASDSRNICGNGWHVPNKAEWDALIEALGGSIDAGRKMRSYGSMHWNNVIDISLNESGFEAFPAGFAVKGQGGMPNKFNDQCISATFLIADRPDLALEITSTSSAANYVQSSPDMYHSCRCVKD